MTKKWNILSNTPGSLDESPISLYFLKEILRLTVIKTDLRSPGFSFAED